MKEKQKKWKDVKVFGKHTLIQHHLAITRDKQTKQKQWNESLKIIALLMAYKITKGLPRKRVSITTPLEKTTGFKLAGKVPAVVAILRAGVGIAQPLGEVFPDSPVGYIDMSRDHETLKPGVGSIKLPDLVNRLVILCETMLATGGSASSGVTILKEHGAKNIIVVGLVAAPDGIKKILTDHPDIKIYVAGVDRCLNKKGYILPGLGDAGDRLCGTN